MERCRFSPRLAALLLAGGLLASPAAAQTIFTDSFASSTLGASWTKSGTSNWRVQTSTGYRVGTTGYGVTFDDSVSGGYSTSQLTLAINLAGKSNVQLSFSFRNVGDESHTQDGLYLSTDGGATYSKLTWAFPAKSSSFSTQTINLSSQAAALGKTLGATTRIRWQQYDDTSLSSDGVALDNVTVTGATITPTPTPTPTPPPGAPSARAGMGPIPYTGGVAFRVWAPNATAVKVGGSFNGWSSTANPLYSEGASGNWSVDVPSCPIGATYKYIITYAGTDTWKPDPRATQMTNSVGDSVVANLSYSWLNSYTQPSWNEAVIYEMHVGTFNDSPGGSPGTFTSAISKLDAVKNLGVSHVELLPIAEFAADFSWGYNPAYPFAPESAYGTPANVKAFVDAAHQRGLGVIVDVVHNHYGPSDLGMWNFDGPSLGNGGIYFFTDWRKVTPWGDTRPDYGRSQVKDYIKDNALYWLNEYHMDGLRWDSTVNIRTQNNGGGGDIAEGWAVMQYANDAVDGAASWKMSIAEDLQGNDYITKTTGSGGAGFDSQWHANFVHPIRTAIIGGTDSSRDMFAVRDAITGLYNGTATQRVIYTESHDEVANGHARVPEEIWPGNAGSWASKKRSTLGAVVAMTSPGIPMIFMGQEMLEDGYWADTDPLDWNKATTYSGIVGLYTDAIKLRRNWFNNTRGLKGNNTNVFHINNTSKRVAYHRWDVGGAGDDTIVVANFANVGHTAYNIGFPSAGTWNVRFNSDWNGYSGDFSNWNAYNTTAVSGAKDGFAYNANVGIGPYTVIILSK
ncbi:hypothetical protein BH09SUM1_BH09SUM1_31280 [soil metagenome]